MELVSLVSGGWFPQNPGRSSIQDRAPTAWLIYYMENNKLYPSPVNSFHNHFMPLWLSALYYLWRMCTRAGLYICMWFLWAVLLGLDELNNQLTLYSLSFVFPGLQLSLNPQPSVCLQPDTMASLRPSQCEQSMWQVKQNLFHLLLHFPLQVIKKRLWKLASGQYDEVVWAQSDGHFQF